MSMLLRFHEKYREDIRTISGVLAYIIVSLSFLAVDNPVFSYSLFALFLVSAATNLYLKIQYRNGNVNYILVPTYNDSYLKMTSLVLGGLILAGAIIAGIWVGSLNAYIFLAFCVGALVFLNGFFDLPHGQLKVKGNLLKLTGLGSDVDLRQLREIKIFKEKILLVNTYNEQTLVGNFNIDRESAKLIEEYLGSLVKNRSNIAIQVLNHTSG